MRSIAEALVALVFLAVALVACGHTAARAFDGTDSALCTAPMVAAEERHEIPTHLLEAISIVESGRWDPAQKRSRAWPWTVYAEGAGHRYASKSEAIAAVAALQARGVSNIDVGCMQVNLHYHGQAFASLDQAFDPITNVGYAADFLHRLRDRERSWPRAVGFYHSGTPKRALGYRTRVMKAWADARRHAAEERRLARLAEYKARREAAKARRASQKAERS